MVIKKLYIYLLYNKTTGRFPRDTKANKMSYSITWEFSRIEKTFLKCSYGNIDRAKEDAKKSLKIYQNAKPKCEKAAKEVENRISILTQLLEKYN